jgi:metal-responsive CopG/Arc/MetJ family transcriptional regulator
MTRTTVSLPDDLAAALAREARRRGVPVSRIVREALEERLQGRPGRRLSFVALGRSKYTSTAEDAEEILAEEWAGPPARDR